MHIYMVDVQALFEKKWEVPPQNLRQEGLLRLRNAQETFGVISNTCTHSTR